VAFAFLGVAAFFAFAFKAPGSSRLLNSFSVRKLRGGTLEAYRKEVDGTWRCSIDMWHHLDPSVIKNPMAR
jgi:hypothetical protein